MMPIMSGPATKLRAFTLPAVCDASGLWVQLHPGGRLGLPRQEHSAHEIMTIV